eukprot:363107-Chlamydomonas_euryale.AAC.13
MAKDTACCGAAPPGPHAADWPACRHGSPHAAWIACCLLEGMPGRRTCCRRCESMHTHFQPTYQARMGMRHARRGLGCHAASRACLASSARHLQDGAAAVECTATGAAPAPSKGTKGKSAAGAAAGASYVVQLDSAWVAEHAVQVARMLPGGTFLSAPFVSWLCALRRSLHSAGPCPTSRHRGFHMAVRKRLTHSCACMSLAAARTLQSVLTRSVICCREQARIPWSVVSTSPLYHQLPCFGPKNKGLVSERMMRKPVL